MMAAEIRRHHVPCAGVMLYVVDQGKLGAPCIVLGHSIMTHREMWAPQLDVLLDLGLRVIRYDSYGHGLSPALPPPYTVDQLAAGVISILDTLNIETTHYIGLSLGGIVGLGLACGHGSRLASMAIADAPAYATPEYARPWDARIQAATSEGMEALVESTMSRWFGPEFLIKEEARANSIRAMIRGTSVDGFVGTARALQTFDYRPQLSSIRMPTTLIVGENDGVLPATMRGIADEIAGSEYKIIRSARHLPNVENPAAFNDVLKQHFRHAL